MEDVSTRRPAVLLVGPTGSGKSPTGAALGRRTGWAHLDFGAELRVILSGTDPHGLSHAEQAYVAGLVERSELFPATASPLVRRIVGWFLAHAAQDRGVILNGVPRHADQARALEPVVDVRLVVVLDCPAPVAAERVARRRAGEGPDHAGRLDDTPGHVRRKLERFAREITPLLAYYRAHAVDVMTLGVAVDTDADALAAAVAARLGFPAPGGRPPGP